jgi:putative NADH-flavin reductase
MNLALFGVSGRTGQLIASLALDGGHSVRALARDPRRVGMTHDRLTLVAGDANDEATVRSVVSGCDAVVSAIGPTKDKKPICSTLAAHVIAAGVKRYVATSGAGLTIPGDSKDVVGKIISFFVRTVTPSVFHDKVREYQLLSQSSVRWTLVRPPRLTDKPATGRARATSDRPAGTKVSRADLAAFTLACVVDDSWICQAPFLAEPG